jgi:hypothetical protein
VRHHRTGKAARDAAIPQTEIIETLERTIVEAAWCSLPGVDDALDSGVLKRVRRPDSLSRPGREWRDSSVGRIDDEPGAAAPGDLERVAKLQRPDASQSSTPSRYGIAESRFPCMTRTGSPASLR